MKNIHKYPIIIIRNIFNAFGNTIMFIKYVNFRHIMCLRFLLNDGILDIFLVDCYVRSLL